MSNFFTQMKSVIGQAEVQINIKTKGDLLTVMVLPKTTANDPALQEIQPLIMSGTPEDLDSGFIAAVRGPLKKTVGLISNVEDFEASTAKAAKETQATKAAEDKLKKEREEETKKFDVLVKRAEELEQADKHSPALDNYRQAVAIKPDDAKVKKRIADLESKLSENSLFDLQPIGGEGE